MSIVRKIYDRKPTGDLNDLDVNTAIWGIFISVTLQAAVHLGQDYLQNLRSVKNQSSKSVEQLFRTTEKLIKDQTEFAGLSRIDWKQPMWRETTLPNGEWNKIVEVMMLNFAESENFRNCAPTLVSQRKLGKDNFSLRLKKDLGLCNSTSRYTQPENWKHPDRRVDSLEYENRPSRGCKTYPHEELLYYIMIESLFKDQTVSWLRIVNVSTNTSQKRRKKFPLRTSNCS